MNIFKFKIMFFFYSNSPWEVSLYHLIMCDWTFPSPVFRVLTNLNPKT